MKKAESPKRPLTWNDNRRGKVPQYQYKTINDIYSLSDLNGFHNVYGVIVDSRHVEKSKGSDFFTLLRIVDSSFCQGEGVKVTLFHHDEKFLPSVNQWDIIRLHRVRAKLYQGVLSLVSSKGWSWVSWKGKLSENESSVEETGKSSSITSTIVAEDVTKINTLRNWISKQGYFSLDMAQNAGENSVDHTLAELKPGCFFNLLCQVAGIAKVNEKLTILKIWDGTMPSLTVECGTYSQDQLLVLDDLDKLGKYMVDVNVFDNHVLAVEESIELGSFIRFCNLHASPKTSQSPNSSSASVQRVELFLHGGMVFDRGVVVLDNNSETVSEMKKFMFDIFNAAQKESLQDSPDTSKNSKKSPEKRKSRTPKSCSPSKRKKMSKLDSNEKSPSIANEEFSTPLLTPDGSLLKDGRDSDACTSHLTAQSQDTLALLTSLNCPKKERPAPSAAPSTAPSTVTHRDVGVQVGEQLRETKTPESLSAAIENETQSLAASENIPGSSQDSHNLRCHQKSVTAVFGDDSPLQITSISDVLSARVSLRGSRLFRIRAKVFRCSDPNDIVFHTCPVSGLRLAAKNDGKNLELSDQAFNHVTKWRELLDRAETENDDPSPKMESQNVTSTQWPTLEESQGTLINVNIETYKCAEDGSEWETLKFKSNFTRKRKKNRSRFNILYRGDHDGNLNLKSAGKNFQRVIRVCSKELLLSRSIPSVAYQNGIYYYCSPPFVDHVSIPSLNEEARTFDSDVLRFVLGCPVLSIQFHLKLLLEDQSDVMEAVLKGRHAVSFFNDVTPEQYLLNRDDCKKSIAEDITRLVTNDEKLDECWAELVIVKKSRRPLHGEGSNVTVYEIVNTRIVL